MEEEDLKEQFRMARAGSEEADPERVDHLLAASGCPIPDWWAESGR